MAVKRIDNQPTITDTIIIDILTPDADGCYLVDPYKVDSITIYYLEKSFQETNYGEYDKERPLIEDQTRYNEAKTAACISPTEENLQTLATTKSALEFNTTTEKIFYNDAIPVAVIGTEDMPAWLSTDVDNALITHIDEDADGNTQYGHFELIWEPLGLKEGNYFVCWTWTPDVGSPSVKITAHIYFTLSGDTQITTSIPTHRTDPKKYAILQELYLPEMFKNLISDGDLTPQVLRGFNNAVGDGFTFLENMTNQMVDLIDANATGESYLIALSNLFHHRLRSHDPTLWRRQIKNAIPNYKQKGTLRGLRNALADADIELNKFTKLWQIISQYTWQENFDVEEDDQSEFTLSELAILPIDLDNFELYYRGTDDDDWTELTIDYVTFSNADGITTMTWVGNNLSINPIALEEDDSIRVIYEVTEVPGTSEQTIEDYIRTLLLMDTRDERDQIYPPKNWNVRVIEEDDAFFDLIIPTRHPYYDPIIWGWVRTEFPYSENIYNMEEYNGSTRESINPCDINRDFIDPCKGCQSSEYSVDVDILNFSNDRLIETQEILKEFTPFHAVLHTINLSSKLEDFVKVTDDVYTLINIKGQDVTIAGNGQLIFNRVMANSAQATRDVLATMTQVAGHPTPDAGTAKNQKIVIFSPTVLFDTLGLDVTSNLLEITSGAETGSYTVSDPNKNNVVVAGIVEPITPDASFSFRLSNRIYTSVTTNIYQDDLFNFSDANVNFSALGTKTNWDVNNEPSYSGGAWEVTITLPAPAAGTYEIDNILSDGTLVLSDPTDALPKTQTTDITYTLLNDISEQQATGTTGITTVRRRGRLDISSLVSLDDVRNILDIGNYIVYSGSQYEIIGFVEGETHQFYIDSYSGGEAIGASTDALNRIASDTGYLHYHGLALTTAKNYENPASGDYLGILNGANGPSDPNDITDNDFFIENYLVMITTGSTTDYYAITAWDDSDMILDGLHQNWGFATGTSVTYTILRFERNAFSILEKSTGPTTAIPGHDFEEGLDRRGNEVIEVNTETGVTALALSTMLNAARKNKEIADGVSQDETVSYSIEYSEEE